MIIRSFADLHLLKDALINRDKLSGSETVVKTLSEEEKKTTITERISELVIPLQDDLSDFAELEELLKLHDDLWLGFSPVKGWVLLDRKHPEYNDWNRPFILLRDGSIDRLSREEFSNEPKGQWSLHFWTCLDSVTKKLAGSVAVLLPEIRNYIQEAEQAAQLRAKDAEWAAELYINEFAKSYIAPTASASDEIGLIKQQYDAKIRDAEERRRQEEKVARHLAAEKQKIDITARFSEYGISCLWHMTHKDNIFSILKYGIVNHYYACKLNVNRVDISDPDVQRWRENIEPYYNRRIHDYAPLYINPRNPMLYVRKNFQEDLCLIEISFSVLSKSQYLITDGNAASHNTKFYSSVNKLELLPWDVLHANYWNDFPDGKRKRCAEVLVYPAIPPKFVVGIHCCSKNTLDFLANSDRNVSFTKKLFF